MTGWKSEQINEIAQALSKAQAQMKPVAKNGRNPHLNNKYATLDDIVEALRVPFNENGLAFSQLCNESESGVVLDTILMHSSGQYIVSRMPIRSMEGNRAVNELQTFGIALTYTKRYALAAMAGVSSDDDSDGEKVQRQEAEQPRQTASKPDQQPPQTGDNEIEVTHIGIHNTSSGKHRIGFWADGEKYPRVHAWSASQVIEVAPFIGLIYSAEHFAPELPDGTRYPFRFSLKHDGAQYPAAVSANFNDNHREDMARMVLELAKKNGVSISAPDDLPTDAWFVDSIAKIRGKGGN
jgi:hypothetical protein